MKRPFGIDLACDMPDCETPLNNEGKTPNATGHGWVELPRVLDGVRMACAWHTTPELKAAGATVIPERDDEAVVLRRTLRHERNRVEQLPRYGVAEQAALAEANRLLPMPREDAAWKDMVRAAIEALMKLR